MATQVQFRRGTTTQHVTFTGAVGELTINLSNIALRVHDGITTGGVEMARRDLLNVDGNINISNANVTMGNLTVLTRATLSNVRYPTNRGTTGQILTTDGVGNAYWANGGATPAGANYYVQYANAGQLASSINFQFDNPNSNLLLGANIIPRVDNSYDIGQANSSWRNLFIDGAIRFANAQLNAYANGQVYTANIGALNADLVNITGTFTVNANAQPNVTSLGNLVSLTVDGNALFKSNVITDRVVSRTGAITIAASAGNSNVVLDPFGNGVVMVSNSKISNVAAPTDPHDAATKEYVDNLAAGLSINAPVDVATTANLATLTGGTVTYNNGANGVGATLTLSSPISVIDGFSLTSSNNRVLVKNEANAARNGIYTWASPGTVLTRAEDFDDNTHINGGDFTFVISGVTYKNSGFVQITKNVSVGTSNINFVQFSGSGTFTAGAGLQLTGTEFRIANSGVVSDTYGNSTHAPSFFVNDLGQLTTVTPVEIAGNAELLTGTHLKSTVVGSSLTSVGNLVSLTVVGNTTAANITATTLTTTGAITANGDITSNGNISVANGKFFLGDGGLLSNIDTTLIKNGQSNVRVLLNGNAIVGINGTDVAVFAMDGLHTNDITSSANLNLRSANNHIDAGNSVIGNVVDPGAPQDVATKHYVDLVLQNTTSKGTVKVATTQGLAATTGGTLSYNNGASGVGAKITTTGTISTIDGVAINTGDLVLVKDESATYINGIYEVTSATQLTRVEYFDDSDSIMAGATVFVQQGTVHAGTGWVEIYEVDNVGLNQIVFAQFAGEETYKAGNNITITDYTVSLANAVSVGSIAVAGISNLNAVGNVRISGGSNGQVLTTDGSSNLAWKTIDTYRISNANSSVTVTSNNEILFTANSVANLLVVTETGITANGIVNLGNVANLRISSGNIDQYLKTDGNGSVSWGTVDKLSLAAGNTVFKILADGNIAASINGSNFIAFMSNTAFQYNGNIQANATLTANNVVSGNDVTAPGNVITDTVQAYSTGPLYLKAGTGNNDILLLPTGNGTINAGTFKITSLGNPTNNYDAATKEYVDSVASGLSIKSPCRLTTTADLATATSGTVTYDNGTAGAGATLTLANPLTLLDGQTPQVGDRILVKSQTAQNQNGIYVYTSSTVLTRASDFDSPGLDGGEFVFVTDGTSYGQTSWVQSYKVTNFASDPIYFAQFGGAGTFTAGTGLTLTGTEFKITNTGVSNGTFGSANTSIRVSVNDQGQLFAINSSPIIANAETLEGGTLKFTVVDSNLKSVGILDSLHVGGNTALDGNVIMGDVSTITITGGQANATSALTTDGAGNLTWTQLTSFGVGPNLSIQHLDANGNLAGTANFTYDSANSLVRLVGGIELVNSGGQYNKIMPNANANVSTSYELPATYGNTGQLMATDGAGHLSWQTITLSVGTRSNGNITISMA